MNLCFLNSIERATFGGMEEWIRLAATGLSARGHRVTVVGRRGSELLRRINRAGTTVQILEIDISGDFNPTTIARIRKYFDEAETNVLFVNFNKDIRLGGLAARWRGGPRVVWSVGLDITSDGLVHRWLTPRLVDRVIVPSEALKRQITRRGYIDAGIVTVIPVGIEDDSAAPLRTRAAVELRRRYHLPDESIIAVTVGRLVEQKGHRHLIEAARTIIERHPQIRFLFVGDGPLRGELEARIAQLDLRQHVMITGMVENVARELAGADLMIHPSIEEPFGIALLEGMRAALPIVASRVGGIPEVVIEGETALLCEAGSSDELAATVNLMLAEPQRMHVYGHSGQLRWQQLFRVDRMIDRLETYLSDLVPQVSCHG
ncbi:MAG TPA: glycosyltransferase family 4 protein [Candidatus Deferrimicrobium sp.]|nr:glycosyltransferase family 4 protein [Candidatus Deferrimicrobium sp.]